MRTPLSCPEPPVPIDHTASRWKLFRRGALRRNRFEFGSASRRGSYHLENEDSVLVPESVHVPSAMAVADGVGGGAQGKVASGALIEHIRLLTPRQLAHQEAADAWLLAADDVVAAAVARYSDSPGASTFVAAVPGPGAKQWLLAWSGDCRAYRVSEAQPLARLTVDETYASLGEVPPAGADPDDPARMIGSGAVDRARTASTMLADGDIMLLCSDGLHKYVPDSQIAAVLLSPGTLQDRCDALVAAAHANGGSDDATAVAVRREGGQPGKRRQLLLLFAMAGAVLVFAASRFIELDTFTPQPRIEHRGSP